MSTLPFDDTRCAGVRDSGGDLVKPCSLCARCLWAIPAGPRSPWIHPPLKDGECELFRSTEET